MKTILFKIGLISILAFLTLGCSQKTVKPPALNGTFTDIRGVKQDNPYGYIEMCKNAWRNNDKYGIGFLCNKVGYCKLVANRTNKGTIGFDSDRLGYAEFCKRDNNVTK